MLVLSRKIDERIVIGENIVVTVRQIAGNRVSLGLEAPRGVRILRGELQPLASATEPPAAARPEGERAPSAESGAPTVVSPAEVELDPHVLCYQL